MSLRRIVLLLGLLFPLVVASPANAIVSGRAVTTGQDSYPWQVAVVTSSSQDADEQWLCGGTLVATNLVLTAAHCVLGDDGRISPPSAIYVLNGSTVLNDTDATDGRITTFTRVADVALYPGVDVSRAVPSGDLALLRLAASTPGGRPLSVVDDSQGGWWATGSRMRITGWGVTSATSTTPASTLRWASVFRVTDDACSAAYGADFVAATMFCALGEPLSDNPSGPVADTCQGDSGGPITAALTDPTQPANPDAWTLVGVTSWGTGCGDRSHPGVYTRLGEPLLRAFATDPTPTWSPVNLSAPTMPASATVGDVVTCAPGTWRGEDITFTYEFHRLSPDGSGSTVVQSGPSSTYTSQPSDAAGLECVVIATNAGGTAWAQSGSTPVTPAAVPTTQVPTTPIPRVPAPDSVTGQVTAATDGASPRSSKPRARCARRRCTVTVRVTDPAPSSGIRRVTGTLRWKEACRRNGRRTTCTRTKRITATRTSAGTWTLNLPRLPRGRASIAILAVDRSGRIESSPAKLTFTVR